MNQYKCLNKPQLSTIHTFLFGVLVDNSRDTGARNLDIYTCKEPSLCKGFYLAFLDDGCGMYYDKFCQVEINHRYYYGSSYDVFNITVFGKSDKRHTLDPSRIDQCGTGLKSGAMRISNDFILFRKKDNIDTCLFLSRTHRFLQEEHISQIMCPMPCFDLTTPQLIENTDNQQINETHTYTYDKIKHELEIKLITKYLPFKTIDELFKQFDLIIFI